MHHHISSCLIKFLRCSPSEEEGLNCHSERVLLSTSDICTHVLWPAVIEGAQWSVACASEPSGL